ncbi:MAG: hypothetical protein AABW67_01405 [Nanoarchaeota archaeon]
MNIKNIFKHKNYPTIMYLSITIVLILIFFSFVNILEKVKNPQLKKEIITGYTTNENLVDYASNNYPRKAFNYYYFILTLTYQLIFIIFIILTYRIKKIFKREKPNDI